MTHDEIKSALNNAGYSLAAACEVMKRSYVQFYNVTNRKSKSKYIANSIAALLGKSVEEVFPDVPQYADETVKDRDPQLIEDGRQKLIDAGLLKSA